MKDNGGMDFQTDLDGFYMMMDHYTKDASTMVPHNANKRYLLDLTAAFLEVEFDKIKLTDMANCLLASFFIKDYGKMIFQMERLDRFILQLLFLKVSLLMVQNKARESINGVQTNTMSVALKIIEYREKVN